MIWLVLWWLSGVCGAWLAWRYDAPKPRSCPTPRALTGMAAAAGLAGGLALYVGIVVFVSWHLVEHSRQADTTDVVEHTHLQTEGLPMTKTVKVKIGLVVCSDGEWLMGEASRSTGNVDWDAIEHYLEPHTEQKRHIIHVEVPLPEVTEINAKAEAVE